MISYRSNRRSQRYWYYVLSAIGIIVFLLLYVSSSVEKNAESDRKNEVKKMPRVLYPYEKNKDDNDNKVNEGDGKNNRNVGKKPYGGYSPKPRPSLDESWSQKHLVCSEENAHIALITLDSLRYDTTELFMKQHEETGFFSNFFKENNHEGWSKRLAAGSYTLPSHMSILHAGRLPLRGYNYHERTKENRMFCVKLKWEINQNCVYSLPESESFVKGLSACGYETVGVGGVGWFSNSYATSSLWWYNEMYFDKFVWREKFSETEDNSFEYQLAEIESLVKERDLSKNLFLFLNVASTHSPYRHSHKNGIEKQVESFKYVDELFPDLLDLLPRPLRLIVLADHGECFGEDGCYGHGVAHPKVMEIPYFDILLE